MRLLKATLAGLLAATTACTAAPTPSPPPSKGDSAHPAGATPSRARHTANLQANATGSHWTGRQTVAFTNTSRTPLRTIHLRLWGNSVEGCERKAVTVSDLKGGRPDPPRVDCTDLPVTLPAPLAENARTTLSFNLAITSNQGKGRMGRDGPYHYFGNSLPVLAVRDSRGQHLAPPVDFGESYYSLASDYRVELRYPKALTVPATGTPSTTGTTATKTTVYTAEAVRDFTWAAGPFHSTSARTPGGVLINVHSTAGVSGTARRRTARHAARAVDDFGRRFGRYPLGDLDVIAHRDLGGTGDMEYPGLILVDSPDDTYGGSAVHEVAHQWWFGIVGNDQYSEPWLDEAFAQFAAGTFFGWREEREFGDGSWPNRTAAVTSPMSYWSTHRKHYGEVVYGNGSRTLYALQRELGRPAMTELLRDYARAHWNGISTTADFRRAAEAAAGRGLGTFFKRHRVR